MDTDLIVDTATLCVVVAIALLFLAFRAWQKRKAALSVQSKGTQTDNPVLNIDSTINRLSLELSTLQQRLESIEQGKLEIVTNNRLLSMLPKSTYFKGLLLRPEQRHLEQQHEHVPGCLTTTRMPQLPIQPTQICFPFCHF